ncbi:hypothetical protein ACOME3_002757 [Neoechinorhynchus agilis]
MPQRSLGQVPLVNSEPVLCPDRKRPTNQPSGATNGATAAHSAPAVIQPVPPTTITINADSLRRSRYFCMMCSTWCLSESTPNPKCCILCHRTGCNMCYPTHPDSQTDLFCLSCRFLRGSQHGLRFWSELTNDYVIHMLNQYRIEYPDEADRGTLMRILFDNRDRITMNLPNSNRTGTQPLIRNQPKRLTAVQQTVPPVQPAFEQTRRPTRAGPLAIQERPSQPHHQPLNQSLPRHLPPHYYYNPVHGAPINTSHPIPHPPSRVPTRQFSNAVNDLNSTMQQATMMFTNMAHQMDSLFDQAFPNPPPPPGHHSSNRVPVIVPPVSNRTPSIVREHNLCIHRQTITVTSNNMSRIDYPNQPQFVTYRYHQVDPSYPHRTMPPIQMQIPLSVDQTLLPPLPNQVVPQQLPTTDGSIALRSQEQPVENFAFSSITSRSQIGRLSIDQLKSVLNDLLLPIPTNATRNVLARMVREEYDNETQRAEQRRKSMVIHREQQERKDTVAVVKTEQGKASDSKEETECVICMDRKREVAFQNCGHFVACAECAMKVRSCPMCRQRVLDIIRIYMS